MKTKNLSPAARMGVGALLISSFALVLYLAVPALARPSTNRAESTNMKAGVVLSIPEQATEVADHVFHLGTAVVDGEIVEGIMFVHYKKEDSHKPNHTRGGKDKVNNKCYAHLARGAKWKNAEPWTVNPANTEGFSDSYLLGKLSGDIQKWENASSTNILGEGTLTSTNLVADTVSPDGKNEVYFGDIASPGSIGVTIIWGRFSGPPGQRELIEWDQVYDQADFDWSSSGEAGKMDFENIATHELGHTVGMGHPDDTCAEETMYRFANFGETKKRDLNTGDTAGVQSLYK